MCSIFLTKCFRVNDFNQHGLAKPVHPGCSLLFLLATFQMKERNRNIEMECMRLDIGFKCHAYIGWLISMMHGMPLQLIALAGPFVHLIEHELLFDYPWMILQSCCQVIVVPMHQILKHCHQFLSDPVAAQRRKDSIDP